MSLNIEVVPSSAKIIQDASSFLAEHGNPEPYLTALIEGFAQEVNGHKDTFVNLTIVPPGTNLNETPADGIDMGEARFNGFIKGEDGKWQADFSLVPEDIPCPVGVEHLLVR